MRIIILCVLLALTTVVKAEVRLADVFSSNMVLQQEQPIPVWGTAEKGETVTVRFSGKTQKVVADPEGHWMAELAPCRAAFKPQQLRVAGKRNVIVLNNILVGEVWLASGQSNMEYSMNNHPQYVKPQKGDPDFLLHAWEKASNPHIRLLYIEKNVNCDTLPTQGWKMTDQASLKPFSAAAWFFAQMLQDSLRVPVGIISTSWGGTKIEEWTPGTGRRYAKMVEPMAPFAIRGFIWYQGESNLIDGDTDIYVSKMERLVNLWRQAWKNDSLPFYYVQISPLMYSQRKGDPVPKTWLDLPRFWDAQTACLKIPHTGMVVTTDIPERLNDIHPPYKWIVGERLARLALHDTYGRKIAYSGPQLASARIEGNQAILEFSHAEDGLVTADGKDPDWFYTSQRNGSFAKANAVIDGTCVKVTLSPQTQHPVIRFGYDEVAQPNLRNKAGLPAIPFEYRFE
ncbi:MAG: sialate O-acetylesterase [Bacteroidales bacterium]|nr:sialate O-acetylesterase [Bacteroidales bacterium]